MVFARRGCSGPLAHFGGNPGVSFGMHPGELFESEHVPAYSDLSMETTSRSGSRQSTEQLDTVLGAETESLGGSPSSQSEASVRVEGGAKTTVSTDGSGQGILHSNDETISVANSRGRRAAKVPSRLVAGNPQAWHFNRAEGR